MTKEQDEYTIFKMDDYETKHFVIKLINFSILISGFFIIRVILKLKNDKLIKKNIEKLYNTKIYKPEK